MKALIIGFVAAAALLAAGPALLPRTSAAALSCSFPEACYTLTVSVGGNGSGSWDSADGSFVADGLIHCDMHDGSVVSGSVCKFTYRTEFGKTLLINYLLTPAVGSDGCHAGNCYSATAYLTVELGSSGTWSIDSFDPQPYEVAVTKSGVATGTVTSSPAGIDCGSTCQVAYLYDTALTLTAMPDPGAAFEGWTQDCAGQGAICTIHVGTSTHANAVFGLATPAPSPTARPTATPTAAPTPSARPTSSAQPSTAPTLLATPAGSAAASAGATEGPSTTPTASLIAIVQPTGSPAQTIADQPAASQAGSQNIDLTPIAVAVFIGLLAIAVGIGFMGYQLRRRA